MKSYRLFNPVLVMMLFTGILLTASCKKITYHQLTEADMSWLVYKNNQIDRYTSGTKSVSYLVTLRTKSYYDNGDVSNEFTTASFKQLNDTAAYYYKDSEGVLYIYKPDANGLTVTLSWPHFPLRGVPLTSLIPTLVTVGGINYPDVYIVDASNLTDARFYNSKIWYSKSTGVLQYEDNTGNLWVRNL